MSNMFCFQCEQTAGGKGCFGSAGVCGKKDDTSNLQDILTSHMIRISRLNNKKPLNNEIVKFMMEGLFTTVTNVSFNNDTLSDLIFEAQAVERALCLQYNLDIDDFKLYQMEEIWADDEDIRSLKSLILFGLRGMAAYAYHAFILGYRSHDVDEFLLEAMGSLETENTIDTLLKLVLKTGEVNLKCMELLDRANTQTYGAPEPTKVSMTIEKGPFIVVSGHDLYDLHHLLEQTKNKGINIYTHGEMLPCHAYPRLKSYPHLKGNFGTAWQNQQNEFKDIPGAVLFTTNCLMPVMPSYKDRVFTTAVVSYPELVHIGEHKDFTLVIEKALELGGYPEKVVMRGINGGDSLTTGFGHGTILGVADKVIDAIRKGSISHIFLVGGCDGAKIGRNYYTEFVQKAPEDSIILTLACGKYRFNDLDLGQISGLPRIMDMGQCNDAFGAIKVASALASAFECSVNELPLSIVLSWYEQKAVCILLSLLDLGIKNIFIGPTLPAFVSPNVLNILVDKYNLTPISTPEADLKKILEK
ncbi:MAG: hydroxylamine reductase [Proteocatella sp.]